MRLSYRGAQYESELPTFQMMEGDVVGKYRGQNLRLQYPYPKHIPVPQTPLDLKYRGVAYSTHRPMQVEDLIASQSVTAASQVNPVQNVRQRVLKEVEETHRTNIYRSLERRLQVAKNLGDQRLIGMLESELQQIV
ncbi:DUF4278 domain-containing protein [Trichocoleus sp. FACHB-591]|uniref:arginine synthesis PII-interacting regulator PirA n=1 Tax=Trichocoleus sp. FACHB-591 TaxID=2692872 RepID=UPI0016858451|nr:DUF4278 domain-containing protein [Trichocoleus sp. FACHB-591]MBD2098428.1 DUF4278 domain-containing protein [Trichocoleus sp. FACHB-591]